mmetsp:Transcript_77352/g.157500  ORF Transcript_77352/g.157500 Transcript_77352/m.157500 type:complete len:87 (-) Transcript_77352:30-290(-)
MGNGKAPTATTMASGATGKKVPVAKRDGLREAKEAVGVVAMESLEVAMGLTTTISKAMDMDTRAIELLELVELPGLPLDCCRKPRQ